MPGNLERECIEEVCDNQELYEVFDDYQDPAIKQYNDCQEIVEEIKTWRKALGSSLSEESEKEILRICFNEDPEALKRYIKEKFDEGRQALFNFIANLFEK